MKARPWPRAVGLGGLMARLLLASVVLWARHVSVGRLILAGQCFLMPLLQCDAGCPVLSAQTDLWGFSHPALQTGHWVLGWQPAGASLMELAPARLP